MDFHLDLSECIIPVSTEKCNDKFCYKNGKFVDFLGKKVAFSPKKWTYIIEHPFKQKVSRECEGNTFYDHILNIQNTFGIYSKIEIQKAISFIGIGIAHKYQNANSAPSIYKDSNWKGSSWDWQYGICELIFNLEKKTCTSVCKIMFELRGDMIYLIES